MTDVIDKITRTAFNAGYCYGVEYDVSPEELDAAWAIYCKSRKASEIDSALADAGKVIVEAAEYELIKQTLKDIRRGPVKPLPDPGAHSWEAFGRAAFLALRASQSKASSALSNITPVYASAPPANSETEEG